jgi:hypothetical protein
VYATSGISHSGLRALRSIVGAAILGFACQHVSQQGRASDGTASLGNPTMKDDTSLLYDREFHVEFPLRGCRLVPGIEGAAGLPLEAFMKLFAVDGAGHRTLIRSPADLAPFVERIDTADQAWSFVRLFTSPDTHYLFQRGDFIVDPTLLGPGDPPELGGVDRAEAVKAGYRPPSVKQEGAFVLERDLLYFPSNASAPVTLIRRRERVALDGAYRHIGDDRVGQIKRALTVTPSYE